MRLFSGDLPPEAYNAAPKPAAHALITALGRARLAFTASVFEHIADALFVQLNVSQVHPGFSNVLNDAV